MNNVITGSDTSIETRSNERQDLERFNNGMNILTSIPCSVVSVFTTLSFVTGFASAQNGDCLLVFFQHAVNALSPSSVITLQMFNERIVCSIFVKLKLQIIAHPVHTSRGG